MTSRSNTRSHALALTALVACIAASPALAAGPTGSASAHDLSVQINLLGLTQLNVGAQTSASVSNATAPVSDAQQVNGIDVADPLSLIKLKTGTLSSEAAYAGGHFAAVGAQSSVNALDLSAVGLGSNNVLSMLANTVVSRSVLAGSCPPPAPTVNGLFDDFVFLSGFEPGNLAPIGDDGGAGGGGSGGMPGSGAVLGDLVVKILGISVPIPLIPPPNTAIDLPALGIAGASLILNERTMSGDGIHSLGLTSNAIRLTLNVAGLVTANVTIAHSEAQLQCP